MARTQPSKRTQPKRAPTLSYMKTFSSASPVQTSDLSSFLALCVSNWQSDPSAYTEDEKRALISSLPPSYRDSQLNSEGLLVCPSGITPELFMTDSHVKRNIARFKRDLREGAYEKTWQDRAKKATQDRVEGKFDEYLRKHVGEMFTDNGEADGSGEDEMERSSDGEFGKGKESVAGKRKDATRARQGKRNKKEVAAQLFNAEMNGMDE